MTKRLKKKTYKPDKTVKGNIVLHAVCSYCKRWISCVPEYSQKEEKPEFQIGWICGDCAMIVTNVGLGQFFEET